MNSVEYMTPAAAENTMTAYRCLVSAISNMPKLSKTSPHTYTFRALKTQNRGKGKRVHLHAIKIRVEATIHLFLTAAIDGVMGPVSGPKVTIPLKRDKIFFFV